MNPNAFRQLMKEAYITSQMSCVLYGGQKQLRLLAVAHKCDFRYFEIGNVRAGALIFDDVVYLVVCGTDDLHDWITNLSARQTLMNFFVVHEGFYEAWKLLQRDILPSDIRGAFEGKRLILGGHSSGGCVAQLLSLSPDFEPSAIYTFGSPRVFSDKSASVYAAYPWKTFRFVMDGDPVPKLPLRKFLKLFAGAKYGHTSAALVLKEDGEVLSDRSQTVVGKTLMAAKAFAFYGVTIFSSVIPEVVKAHRSTRYRDAIETHLAKNNA